MYFEEIRTELSKRLSDYRLKNPIEFSNFSIEVYDERRDRFSSFGIKSATAPDLLFRMDKSAGGMHEPVLFINTRYGSWITFKFERYNEYMMLFLSANSMQDDNVTRFIRQFPTQSEYKIHDTFNVGYSKEKGNTSNDDINLG